VRRFLLVLAMLISLWPVAVIANAAITGSSDSSNSTSDSGTSSSPSVNNATASQPDYAGLKRLQDREGQLLQQLHNSQSLHGVADPGLAEAARHLVADYQAWHSSNSGLDARADKIEALEATVAQRVVTFASHPSQAALNAFNQGVAAYNADVSASAR
jgi:hypothetical protein